MKRMSAAREEELRQILNSRGREMQNQVHGRIRGVRADRTKEVLDEVENSDAGTNEAIEFALIQMQAETLRRIQQALIRLDAGKFGYCFECAGEISEHRLRALPFAVRCTACEEKREQGQERSRQMDQRRVASLFSDAVGY
jgi:DnaK suppressor protein